MINLIKNFYKNNTGMLIRLDDISECMNWELMGRCEVLFDKNNIKPLLGVIPNNQDSELMSYKKNEDFWNKVREWKNKGWEITMHGSTHIYDTKSMKKDYFGYYSHSTT